MEKRWQGKLLAARWEEDQLNQRGCFMWLKDWNMAPTHTIVVMLEFYEQVTLTKVYQLRVRPVYINLMTPYVDFVAKLSKVSLMCWRVAPRLHRISTLRVTMRPSRYCSGRCLESFTFLIWCHSSILRSFPNPNMSHLRSKHIGTFQSLQ